MEHTSAAFVDCNIFCGFLEMETKANSGVFHRRFLRLDPNANVLEYFADRQEVVCSCSSLLLIQFDWLHALLSIGQYLFFFVAELHKVQLNNASDIMTLLQSRN